MTARTQDSRPRLGLFSVRNRLLIMIVMAVIAPVIITQVVGLSTTQSSLSLQIDQQFNTLVTGESKALTAVLATQIELLTVLADNQIVKDAVVTQTDTYTGTETEIEQTILTNDEVWRAADAANNDRDSLVRSVLQSAASEPLVNFRLDFPDHVELFVTDTYGANVGTTNRTSDYYQADEGWWQAIWNDGEGAVYIANEMEFDESANVYSINMGVPILTDTGEPIGVMRTTFQVGALRERVSALQFGETGRAILVNHNAQILASQDLESFGTTWSDLAPILTEAGEQDAEETFTLLDETGRTVITGAALLTTDGSIPAIDSLNWFLVVVQSEEEALSPVNQAVTSVLVPAAIIIVIGLVAAYYLANQIANPLRRATDVAERIAAGDLDQRINVTSQDEIGILSYALNNMTDQLQDLIGTMEQRIADRTRDLETVVDVNEQISTILDLDRLLQDMVDLTKERFGLYHSHVYMLNEAGDTLVLTSGAGHVGRQMVAEVRTIDFNNRDSIVATAARTREGMVVNDVTESPTFLPHALLPRTRSELAVPLIARGRVLGVLDVQSDEVGHFTEEVFGVLEIMAGQISTALSNAQLFEVADRTSRHEAALGKIDRQIQEAVDMDEVLQVAVRELGKALRVPHTAIELRVSSDDSEEDK